MDRRGFLAALGAGTLAAAAYRFWPDQGFVNPCLAGPLPRELADHPLVRSAWDGIDPRQFWDCHVHLVGVGDGGHGVWFNPAMDSLWSPLQYARKKFYLNASCADGDRDIDARYVDRLAALHADLSAGSRLMLLAFDYYCDERGAPVPALSTYYAPNEYARFIAQKYPHSFEWIASIHPYRPDAVERLEWAARHGARAVKWLPPAMGMDPASPRCDRFYDALARWKLPLLTHAGEEQAVQAKETQALGNPLRLRRALDRGVRVIVAHCASLGFDVDLDEGVNGKRRSSFDLFARMMGEARYEGLLFGEISALTQVNRLGRPLREVLARTEWHARLINGSDYPLPAVMPVFSLKRMVTLHYLKRSEANILSAVRRYNPVLFDFLLKRSLAFNGRRLPANVFHSRRLFEPTAVRLA
jgi:mannonate dehydratase